MSDRPIQVGDLVVVNKSLHSCLDLFVGRIGVVTEFSRAGQKAKCGFCNAVFPDITPGAFIDDCFAMPTSWLKRIPPLSELESTEKKEELTV